jgi:LPS-assembly lipoprotein
MMRPNSCLLKTSLLLLLLSMQLAACGFHLRGDVELPPEVKQLAIEEAEKGPMLVPVLNTLFRRNDIKPVADLEQAKLVLEILSESYKRRVITVSSAGQVQEYELIYAIKYSIKNKENERLSLLGQKTTVKRDLRFSVTEVLGKTSEENRLKEDMVNAAAEQILRRLPKAAM